MNRPLLSTLIVLASLVGLPLRAQDFLCAEVKIEILQELTLERQAFEARMRIINNLNIPLNDIEVQVLFFDEEGNPVLSSGDPDEPNPDVKFFIRENEPGVPESVGADTDERFTWLIIPTITAGGESPVGVNYNVGAILTYKVGNTGEEERVEVIPDRITVKPLPELQLDYFLPLDVYADNPNTQFIIEPPVPFSLGVRIKNIGFGDARSVKIDSAQPRIVENELDLLINFVITGSEINGVEAPNSLLIDFGDIPPASERFAATARWIMETNLSGQFTQFDATVSHSDELGGELTALITNENLHTHKLLREVVVDLPGRDDTMDFLSCERDDPNVVEVYESNGTESDVSDKTSGSGEPLPFEGGVHTFTLEGEAGFSYVKFRDPFNGRKEIASVERSDGKSIREENRWLHRSWNRDLDAWEYFFSVFDVANLAASTYTVHFRDPAETPQAPVMQLIVDRTTQPGEQVGFIVQATDTNADFIEITGDGLPSGSSFVSSVTEAGRSVKFFTWTPSASQVGTVAMNFVASDPGGLTDSQVVHVFVSDGTVSGFDSWIARHFGDVEDLDIIGPEADPDLDTMTNLAEYGQLTNPLIPDREFGPRVAVEPHEGDMYLTMTYRRRVDDPSLTFTVRGAGRISRNAERTVQNETVAVSQEGVPDGAELVKIRDSIPLTADNARRYLELDVSRFTP